MFYAHFVLSKKGPLARIWLAAHWDKKLTRAHVFETNISSSVEAILEPKLKMALRTSGHLLLGVVRIYSRKAKYLLADCNEIYVKIKTAFRPGMVDLPDESNREAAIAAITLPENIQDYEATMADLTAINLHTMTINQSRPEDITMREDFGEINLGRQDDDFGDSAFVELPSRETLREGDPGYDSIYGRRTDHSGRFSVRGTDPSSIRADDAEDSLINVVGESINDQDKMYKRLRGFTPAHIPTSEGVDLDDDAFGGGLYDADSDGSFGGEIDHTLFASPNLFEDPAAQTQLDNALASDFVTGVNASELSLQPPSVLSAEKIMQSEIDANRIPISGIADSVLGIGHGEENGPLMHDFGLSVSAENGLTPQVVSASLTRTNLTRDNTCLLSNESEAFALLPIDVTATSTEPRRAAKRKRRLIIDEQKSIPSELMKIQMQNTDDITIQLDLAPPTKRLMHMKETGGLDKLFTLPGRAIPSRILQRLFTRNLHAQSIPDDAPDEIISAIYRPLLHTDGNISSMTQQSLSIRDMLDTPSIYQQANMLQRHDNLHVIPEETLSASESGFLFSERTHPHEDVSPSSEQLQSVPNDQFAAIGSQSCHGNDDRLRLEEVNDPFMASVDHTSTRPTDIPEPRSIQSDDMDDGGADFQMMGTPYLAPPSILSEAPVDVLAIDRELASPEERVDLDISVAFDDDALADDNIIEGVGETDETEEERRLEKRSKEMLRRIRSHVSQHGWSQDGISLLAMCESNTKKQAASKFYTALLLRKQGSVDLYQSHPFSDIRILRGPMFSGPIEA